MTITLDGHDLTIEKVVQVARGNEKIDIHPEAIQRIQKCRDLLEDKIKKKEIMYGVNTCLLYTSPSPRDRQKSRMPSSA
jgi:histidine ammonia-lyase